MTLNPWRRPEPLDHAELARLLPAPGEPALSDDRQLLLEEHLMREIGQNAPETVSAPRGRSRRRLVGFVVPGVLLALAGGAVAATTLVGGSSPASERNTVRCYSAADLSAQYNSIAQAEPVSGTSPADISATISAAINACAGLWESTLIQHGKVGHPTVQPGEQLIIPDDATPGQGNVPPLTACVLDGGEAAVFPGAESDVCRNLGLAQLADRR